MGLSICRSISRLMGGDCGRARTISGRSAGKPLRYVLGRARPHSVPASRARRAPARRAGGLASSCRPGPSTRPPRAGWRREGTASSSQATHRGRGAPDRGEHHQDAGAAEPDDWNLGHARRPQVGQSADGNADGFILCALVALVQDVVSVLGSGSRCLASAPRTSAMIAMCRPKNDNLGLGVDRRVSKLSRGEFDGRPQIVRLS
jgi:hypothetical protein